jgi:hypothetical protein
MTTGSSNEPDHSDVGIDKISDEGKLHAHTEDGSSLRPDPICVIDSDILLQDPERIMTIYCNEIGYPFRKEMLYWDKLDEKDRGHYLVDQGFHDQLLSSSGLGGPNTVRLGKYPFEAIAS